MFAQLTLGAVLAAGGVALIRAAVPRRFERPFWAAGLVAAALVYVVLAFRAELSAELSVEVVGAGVFAMLALLGVRVSSWFLAAGWGAHALWDLGVPALIDTSFIPTWYTFACVGFDLVVGGYLVGLERTAYSVGTAGG
jgi:hypothetical protein